MTDQQEQVGAAAPDVERLIERLKKLCGCYVTMPDLCAALRSRRCLVCRSGKARTWVPLSSMSACASTDASARAT